MIRVYTPDDLQEKLIEFLTATINGKHENDFIMTARIDALIAAEQPGGSRVDSR